MKILRAGEKGFDRYLSEVEGRVAQDGLRFEKEVRSILKDVRNEEMKPSSITLKSSTAYEFRSINSR